MAGLDDSLLPPLFDQLPIGVVVIDRLGRVVHFNRVEERLARRKREQVLGKRFFEDVAPCMNVRELAGAFHDRIGRAPLSLRVELALPFPHLETPRDVVVQLSSFDVGGSPYGCLFVEDVSAQRAVARMKDTLSQLLVHDLKAPLTVMLGKLQLLGTLPSVAGDAEAAEMRAQAEQSGWRLQHMLVNLLDVTRLETDGLPLTRAVVDLRGLVASSASDLGTIGRGRGIEVVADLPSRPVTASIDRDVMRRALDNLVDNAVRFASRRVVVRCLEAGRDALLEVVDDGPGVPEALRDRIFQKYGQGDDARGRWNRGLGLTFVRLAARAHGGEAEVDSPVGGGGSVFRIRAPKG